MRALRKLKEQGLTAALCGNLGSLLMAREAGLRIIGDYGLNIINSPAAQQAAALGCDEITLPSSASAMPPGISIAPSPSVSSPTAACRLCCCAIAPAKPPRAAGTAAASITSPTAGEKISRCNARTASTPTCSIPGRCSSATACRNGISVISHPALHHRNPRRMRCHPGDVPDRRRPGRAFTRGLYYRTLK